MQVGQTRGCARLRGAVGRRTSRYVYKQVTDNEDGGKVAFNGGNRGRAVAVGPFVRYRPSRDWGVTVSWQPEFLVENRASGNRF
jgi:hypothetical protein